MLHTVSATGYEVMEASPSKMLEQKIIEFSSGGTWKTVLNIYFKPAEKILNIFTGTTGIFDEKILMKIFMTLQ